RRCPAGVALAHDDARPGHRDRQPLPPVRDKALRLELRLLVGVAEALSHVEVVLAEAPRVLAGDEGRRDVREAPQAPPRLAALRELEHTSRALHVYRARGLQVVLEGHRSGAVHALADALCQRLAAAPE